MSGLDGSVSVVTGASSGIGSATAKALADAGATVALVARNAEALQDLASTIEGDGGRALAMPADLTDSGQAADAIERIVAETGRIDALVNSAGLLYLSRSLEADVRQWRRLIDINVMGLLNCTHAALPHLLKSAQGPRGVADIVNFGSVASRVVRDDNGVYAASKRAVDGISESLRKEFTGRHLRVCVVEPGMVETPMTQGADRTRDGFTWLEPDDVADAVRYVLTRPWRATINDIVVRPTEQER